MIFGSLGSENHLSFEIVGDHANLGARLEGLTKTYRCRVIASETTIRAAGNIVVARDLDLVRVKGKTEPVRIFEILGPAEERDRWQPLLQRFEEGLSAYRERCWDASLVAFEAVLDIHPDDGPTAVYVQRCRSLMANPHPTEWDAITVMETK